LRVGSLRKRKAISPVLATVILIAITLIAAIAVAGFVFGLFGTFTSSATLSIQAGTVICSKTGGQLIAGYAGSAVPASGCGFEVTNTGAGSGSLTAAGPANGAVTFGTLVCHTTAWVADAGCAITGNQNILVTVVWAGATPGQSVQGWVSPTAGAQLNFVTTVLS